MIKKAQLLFNMPLKWQLTLIFILAFSIRIAMNIAYQGINAPPNPNMGSDHVDYEQLARNVVKGNGYVLDDYLKIPNTSRAPGVSFLLIIAYSIFGMHYYVARILFVTISALTCIVTYFIGSKLGGRKTGIVAACILAVYPMHFYYSMHLFSEVPFALFSSLAVLSAILMREKKSPFHAVLLGVFSAMSTLIRAAGIYYLPFYLLLLCLFEKKNDRNSFIKLGAISIISFILCLSPWVYRNYIVTGHFVPIALKGGVTFLGANNEMVLHDPSLIGSWTDVAKEENTLREEKLTAYFHDKKAYQIGIDFLKNHVRDIPKLEFMKFYRAITPFYETPNKTFNLIGGGSWLVLMPFALLGIALTLKNRSFIPLHAAVALTLFGVLVFYGSHRFRESIAPLLVLYGTIGIFTVLKYKDNDTEILPQDLLHNPNS
jgi:4-amino-4-deoxy-L-arabinose transferase-like glycosyltransferase